MIKRFFLIVLMAWIVSGCGVLGVHTRTGGVELSQDVVQRIKPGMGKIDVLAILGRRADAILTVNDEAEIWVYRSKKVRNVKVLGFAHESRECRCFEVIFDVKSRVRETRPLSPCACPSTS